MDLDALLDNEKEGDTPPFTYSPTSLSELCATEVARLVVLDRRKMCKILNRLPWGIVRIVLMRLPGDVVFYYQVMCNEYHFDLFDWECIWSIKYNETLRTTKELNEDRLEPSDSWSSGMIPLLPRSLDGFYVDMKKESWANREKPSEHFATFVKEMKRIISCMRGVRQKPASPLKKKNAKQLVSSRKSKSRAKGSADRSFNKSERGLLKPTSKRTSLPPIAKRKKTQKKTPKPSKSAGVLPAKKYNFCVPLVFGCNATEVALNFFFPFQNILESLWKNEVRPPFIGENSLVNLTLRGASIDNGLVSRICQQHKLLQKLDLTTQDCRCTGSDALLSIANHLHKLKELRLGCWPEDAVNFESIDAFCNVLQSEQGMLLPPRDEARAAKSAARKIRQTCKVYSSSLIHLDLSNCLGVNSSALNTIFSKNPGILDMCVFGCYMLTSESLFGMTNPDCRLVRLNYSGAYKLTDQEFVRPLLSVHPDIVFYNSPNEFGDYVTTKKSF